MKDRRKKKLGRAAIARRNGCCRFYAISARAFARCHAVSWNPREKSMKGSTMGATAAIAKFIATTSLKEFPAASIEKAKKALVDTFAVIIAGAGSEVAE